MCPCASDLMAVRINHLTLPMHVVVLKLANIYASIILMVTLTLSVPHTIKPLPIVVAPLINDAADPLALLGIVRRRGPVNGMPSGRIRDGWMLVWKNALFVRPARLGMRSVVMCPVDRHSGGQG